MNYFDLFGLPMQLSVDKALLTQRFQKLTALEDNDRLEASSNNTYDAAVIHTAYKTLLNHDETIKYVLQLKGLMHEEEKYEPDPEFLMTVEEINQSLAEVTEAEQDKVEAIESEVKDLLKNIYTDVEPVIENYEEGTVTEKELLQVKEYYYRKKFLQRVLDKVAQMRNIAAL